LQLDQPQIHLETFLVEPAPGIGVPQGEERVEEIGVGGEELFVELDFEIQQLLRF